MILIGLFDSPFTRRVAIALSIKGYEFEHRAWSVGADFDRIREYSPLGRVPVLILDDGTVLTESAAILDWLEHAAGGDGLYPRDALQRREAMRVIGLASGAADRGVAMVLERIFHPQPHQSQALLERGRVQIEGALSALNEACDARGGGWLAGDAMSLADITVATHATYLKDAAPADLTRWPALAAHVARCEALPVFQRFYQPFYVPRPRGAGEARA